LLRVVEVDKLRPQCRIVEELVVLLGEGLADRLVVGVQRHLDCQSELLHSCCSNSCCQPSLRDVDALAVSVLVTVVTVVTRTRAATEKDTP